MNKYINSQTKEELDLNRISKLKDNAMVKTKPQFFIEWNFKKNDELCFDVYAITKGSNKKVWWVCEKGHEWNGVVSNRYLLGRGCPYCSNQKILIGYNDLWTTNPEVANMLNNPYYGYKYSKGATVKVDWRCPNCKDIVKRYPIQKATYYGLRCTKCSDNRSCGEKLVYNLLNNMGIDFEYDRMLPWSDKKRYDFYISSLQTIIEVHGLQHYQDTKLGYEPLECIQNNDKYKQDLALNNGIKNYIIIDARNNDLNFIKSSIINSDLNNIIDISSVDWDVLFVDSSKSFILRICELYRSGIISSREIGKLLKISRTTVARYLKQASSYGWIDYDHKEFLEMKTNFARKKNSKKVLQFNLNGELIKEWNSITEVRKSLKVSNDSIKKYCENSEIWMDCRWELKVNR